MKLGSWDVGLKNLSYCLLLHENKKNTIIAWDNINIVDEEPIAYCSQVNMNGKKCPYKATSTADITPIRSYFCKKHERVHSSLVAPVMESIKNSYTTPATGKCRYVLKKKQTPCGKCAHIRFMGSDGDKNSIVFCKAHHKKRLDEHNKQLRLLPIKKVNANKFPIDQLKLNLFTILDTRPELLLVDEMIIENQPVYKNPRMKSIANALFDYFVIRGVIDRSVTKSTIQKVRFICPSNKLKVDADNTIKTLSKTDDGEKYKITKALAIQYCTQMIAGDAKHAAFLKAAKKKDDLCDCYLQGVHYLSLQK